MSPYRAARLAKYPRPLCGGAGVFSVICGGNAARARSVRSNTQSRTRPQRERRVADARKTPAHGDIGRRHCLHPRLDNRLLGHGLELERRVAVQRLEVAVEIACVVRRVRLCWACLVVHPPQRTIGQGTSRHQGRARGGKRKKRGEQRAAE